MDLFWGFFEARADRSAATDYGNVIHPTMFASDDIDESTLILLLVPPPELHLLIGPVNTLYEELSKVWVGSENWIKKINIKREEYHGGSFNGNDSRKLLKNVGILKELLLPSQCKLFIEAFESFNDVVTACYGKHLSLDYKDKIKKFRACYKKLNIDVTPKIHAVFYHIEEFCEIVKMPLGPFSEQTAESLHSDFKAIWKNYKVRDTGHDEYSKRLLESVIAYNSGHL